LTHFNPLNFVLFGGSITVLSLLPHTRPPPSVAKIGGTITGLKTGDRAYIAISSLDLEIELGVNIVNNGPWFVDLPKAGEYQVKAEATGYTVNPPTYKIEIAEGQELLTLDFEVTQ
jgi:hypothetical protein